MARGYGYWGCWHAIRYQGGVLQTTMKTPSYQNLPEDSIEREALIAERTNNEVVIEVEGGVATVAKCPYNVQVRIVDLD